MQVMICLYGKRKDEVASYQLSQSIACKPLSSVVDDDETAAEVVAEAVLDGRPLSCGNDMPTWEAYGPGLISERHSNAAPI